AALRREGSPGDAVRWRAVRVADRAAQPEVAHLEPGDDHVGRHTEGRGNARVTDQDVGLVGAVVDVGEGGGVGQQTGRVVDVGRVAAGEVLAGRAYLQLDVVGRRVAAAGVDLPDVHQVEARARRGGAHEQPERGGRRGSCEGSPSPPHQ